jgi:fermentation-respiration switch protein FrsA (DUF1100 family)
MMENTLIRIALYAGGIYLLLNLFALLISDRLLFQPQAPSYTHLPYEVKIATADGERINAVWLEIPGAKQTLLFSHGNAEDLGRVLPFIEQFHALGYSVLMYDYRGYGTSEGRPSYRKIHRDADAAYRWLVEEKKVPPESIIAHGRSLGGAVAIWTAAHHDVGGLIVESSFASAFRVKTVVPLLPWDKFNSIKAMKQVRCPVLVMHGTADSTLPFWHGKAIFNAAPAPKQHFWIKDGEHNNYAYVAEQSYFDSIQAFLASLTT